MAEAEDVITDLIRHGVVQVQALWRRQRPPPAAVPNCRLADCANRIELLLVALFGQCQPLRNAQRPDRKSVV